MTTSPSSPAPAPNAPFNALLRGALVPSIAVGLVAVVVLWVLRQSRGGLAGLLGVAVAVVFFAVGLYVMKRVVGANPLSVLAGAQWLDGTAFGLAILVVALVWQACQVVTFLRMRHSVYDAPSAHGPPSGPATGGGEADPPAAGRAPGEGR